MHSLFAGISECRHIISHIFTTRGAIAKRTAALDSAHQIGLSTSWEDGLTVVGGLSLVESKNSEIGPDFRHISTTKAAMAKGMAGLDSGHQIYPSTPSEDALTVYEGVCRWRLENREMGEVLTSGLGTSGDTGKWMVPLDSAHRICVSTISKEVLNVDQGGCRWSCKSCEIGDVFASALGTSGDMAKRIAAFDSAHQICVCTISKEVLTVDQGGCRWRCQNREIEDVFASAFGSSGDTAKQRPPFDLAHRI